MKISKYHFALLIVLYLIASIIRLSINFATEFIPGSNGAFYLANVRSILETGEILFKDFPLIFWIEALLAKIFIVSGITGFEKSIDLACRLFDSFVPTLSIIPAYFLIKRLTKKDENPNSIILFTSLSILFISFLLLVSDFQKNSLGLLWLFSLMLWVHKSLEEKKIINYIISFIFVALTGATHFGCFLVAILYIILVLLINNLVNRKIYFKTAATMVLLLITAYIIIYAISPPRLRTVIDFIYNMFRNPVIILFFEGKPVLSPIDLASIFLINMTAVFAAIMYVKNYKTLSSANRVFILSALILTFFLALPFIGFEWSQRLSFISYIPAVSLMPFILDNIVSGKRKKNFMVTTIIVVLLSVFVRMSIPVYSNMNREQYSELRELKEKLPKDGNVLMVARHGLEWWSSYILRMPVIKEGALEKIYWDRFKYMLFIIQKKDKAPFGPIGIFGTPFREPRLPEQSNLILEGEYFDIYWAKFPPVDMSIFFETP
ncbi:MAG: hypothetical protein GYA14_03385 [Ignavibacteria bacterium]|nr:hypothetical protein [Ignavibacteria bacterium]